MKNIPIKLYDHENCDDKVWYGQDLLVSRSIQDNAELPKLVNCQQYGLILLTEGEAEYTINLRKAVLRAPVLWVATPHTVWEYHQRAEQSSVKGCLVVVSENLIKRLQIVSSHPLRNVIHKEPFFGLLEEEKLTFLSYMELIYRLAHLSPNSSNDRLINSVLESLYHYFIQIFEQKNAVLRSQKKQSRSDHISGEFIRLAQIHAPKQHNISFYAAQLHVSEKYLSNIIKRVTGKPPRAWIDEIIMKEAVYMLYDENKSIQQISDTLNFSSPSLFGVFFKRKSGTTPMQYRKNLGQ